MVFLSRHRNHLFLMQTSAMTPFLSLLLDKGSEMLPTGSGKKKISRRGHSLGLEAHRERSRRTWKGMP